MNGGRFRGAGFADEHDRLADAQHQLQQPLASLRVRRRHQNLVEVLVGVVDVPEKRNGGFYRGIGGFVDKYYAGALINQIVVPFKAAPCTTRYPSRIEHFLPSFSLGQFRSPCRPFYGTTDLGSKVCRSLHFFLASSKWKS